ncbi:Kelch repeat-containing protein [Chloroflexota bacterium]
MSNRYLYQKTIKVTLIGLILVGCGSPAVRSTVTPPIGTPTAVSMGGSWTTGTDMLTPRWEHSVCVVDGKIYVIGGAGPIYQAQGTVELYDPVSDTWETKSPMPTARQALSTSVVNGKIYAIGGGVSLDDWYGIVETYSTVEEYDPATDTWTIKASMPTSRGWHSASVIDGKIYIFGGSQNSGPSTDRVLTVEVYDPATDTWNQKENMPGTRASGHSSVMAGKIYLIGGYGVKYRVDEYDPSTDTWTAKSEIPTLRIAPSTNVLDGKIYLIGGLSSIPIAPPTQGTDTIDVYDPVTDTWATAPDMPTARMGAYASVVDGRIYVFGGLTEWPGEAIGIVEIYEP